MCDMPHSLKCDITRSHVWHESFASVTWIIHMCDMGHSCLWQDLFIRVPWLIHICVTHQVLVSRQYVGIYIFHTCDMTHSWLIHIHDITHSYVWHDSFIRVTWLVHICVTHQVLVSRQYVGIYLIHTCDMTHSYTLHNLFICVTWLVHACDMTRSHMCDTPGAGIATVCGYLPHSYVWHDSFTYVWHTRCWYRDSMWESTCLWLHAQNSWAAVWFVRLSLKRQDVVHTIPCIHTHTQYLEYTHTHNTWATHTHPYAPPWTHTNHTHNIVHTQQHNTLKTFTQYLRDRHTQYLTHTYWLHNTLYTPTHT